MTDLTSQIRAEHRLETRPLQTAVDRITAVVGWPGFVVAIAGGIVLWVAANLLARQAGWAPFDPPPFARLQGILTGGALMTSALILTTQRREDQLAGHRAQMVLELTVLCDQKLSKVIELLEEGRRDNPALKNRFDGEAAAMSMPADTRAVLDAIKEIQAEAD